MQNRLVKKGTVVGIILLFFVSILYICSTLESSYASINSSKSILSFIYFPLKL